MREGYTEDSQKEINELEHLFKDCEQLEKVENLIRILTFLRGDHLKII